LNLTNLVINQFLGHFDISQFQTKTKLDERDRVDAISSMFLPRKEVAQIRNGTIPEPEYFPRASILNFDIVGYTVISKRSTPKEIFLMLETLFTLFDDTLHNFPNLFKVETLGDSYMISAGCPVKYDSHEMDLARFALQVLSLDNLRAHQYLDSLQNTPELPNSTFEHGATSNANRYRHWRRHFVYTEFEHAEIHRYRRSGSKSAYA